MPLDVQLVSTYSDTDKRMTAEWTNVSYKCVLVRHIYFSGNAVRQKQTKCYSCIGSAVMYSALHTKILHFTVHLHVHVA